MNTVVLVLLAALSLTVFLTGLASGARRLLGIARYTCPIRNFLPR